MRAGVGRISDLPWRLGKLGGVFVVPIATGVILYFVFTGNPQPDPNQSAIRRYYESTRGGRVPRTAADSLRVDVCDVQIKQSDCDRVVYDPAEAFVVAP
jgi:hypothetical protein